MKGFVDAYCNVQFDLSVLGLGSNFLLGFLDRLNGYSIFHIDLWVSANPTNSVK